MKLLTMTLAVVVVPLSVSSEDLNLQWLNTGKVSAWYAFEGWQLMGHSSSHTTTVIQDSIQSTFLDKTYWRERENGGKYVRCFDMYTVMNFTGRKDFTEDAESRCDSPYPILE